MRTKAALTIVALTAVLAGCGGTSSPEAIGTLPDASRVAPTTGTTATTPARGARRRHASKRAGTSCDARGITTPPFHEGACVEGGTRYVVAHGRSVVHLRTLAIAIRSFSVSEEIGHGAGAAQPQQGAFLNITVHVENDTNAPQRFGAGQTLLEIRGEQYRESAGVEKRIDRKALGYAGRAPIAPGQSVEGDIVYDLPPNELQAATAAGQLYVIDFGASGGHAERGVFLIGQA